jgi:hypothetical protein
MGLRDDARRAAAASYAHDEEVKRRVAQTKRDLEARLRRELAAWSERTGFPVRRIGEIHHTSGGNVCTRFQTDDKIWLGARLDMKYDPSEKPTGHVFEVTYGRHLVNSLESLGIALKESDR